MSILTFDGHDYLLMPVKKPIRCLHILILLNFKSELKLHLLREASLDALNKEAPHFHYSLSQFNA